MTFKLSNTKLKNRALSLISMVVVLALTSTAIRANNGSCGGVTVNIPFTDVQSNSIFFCSIAEAYFSGLTYGTTATTYSPSEFVTREQMAAFITRTLDQSLARGSQRAALGQWWTQQYVGQSAVAQVGGFPQAVRSDGQDLWVACPAIAEVQRVRASDGSVLDFWSADARDVFVANGRVYSAGGYTPGHLYAIDPTQPGGSGTFLADVCDWPSCIAFDGEHLLIGGSKGITVYHTPSGVKITYTSSSEFTGALFDGNNFWVTDSWNNTLKKFRVDGAVLQSVNVGTGPSHPVFDGTNIWVPNQMANSVSVVRASSGTVIATLTGNGLNGPVSAAFDGERILIANRAGNSVSLWRATDLAPIDSLSTGANSLPTGVCSDGRNFWITLQGPYQLARF